MQTFTQGIKHGISIALGYLSVSFSFGILGVQSGLTIWQTILISITNLTSAGQVAGVELIAANAAYVELFLTELLINLRYAFMSLALSQKADRSFHIPQRLLAAFGITDEIFAVASIQPGTIKPKYLYGMIGIAFLGWVGGTTLGAVAGSYLPVQITNALGIALYGMFLAIIIPPAKKSRGILAVIICAVVLRILLTIFAKWVTGGFSMILAALIAAVLGAWLFPVSESAEQEADA